MCAVSMGPYHLALEGSQIKWQKPVWWGGWDLFDHQFIRKYPTIDIIYICIYVYVCV